VTTAIQVRLSPRKFAGQFRHLGGNASVESQEGNCRKDFSWRYPFFGVDVLYRHADSARGIPVLMKGVDQIVRSDFSSIRTTHRQDASARRGARKAIRYAVSTAASRSRDRRSGNPGIFTDDIFL